MAHAVRAEQWTAVEETAVSTLALTSLAMRERRRK